MSSNSTGNFMVIFSYFHPLKVVLFENSEKMKKDRSCPYFDKFNQLNHKNFFSFTNKCKISHFFINYFTFKEKETRGLTIVTKKCHVLKLVQKVL